MSFIKITRFALLPALLAAAILAGCSRSQATPGAGAAPPPPTVSVAEVLSRPLRDFEEFTGRLEPVTTVSIQPRVAGFIDSAQFDEGAHVKKGQLLFRIDPRPFQAEVDRLAAQREQARSQLDLARANARRARLLLAKHAIAQEAADQQTTAAQSAQATLAAANAALAAARLNLGFTDVRAPIDGRVSNAHITPGNLVTSADVLTSVVSVNPVYVYFDADEHTWLKLDHLRAKAPAQDRSMRMAVAMGLADEQGYPHTGRLDFVDNQMHSDSGTMRLRAVFDNPHGLLTPGLYAHVRLQAGRPEPRILINDRAVGTDLGNQFVYVLGKQDKVQYRRIVTGGLFHGMRVVDSGLNPGDVIVVNGLQRVRPGVAVAPQTVAMDYQLGARDKALVDAAGARARADKRTAQAGARTAPNPEG